MPWQSYVCFTASDGAATQTTETTMTSKSRKPEADKIYASAFYNALGHGMSEAEADAYATRRVNTARGARA